MRISTWAAAGPVASRIPANAETASPRRVIVLLPSFVAARQSSSCATIASSTIQCQRPFKTVPPNCGLVARHYHRNKQEQYGFRIEDAARDRLVGGSRAMSHTEEQGFDSVRS